MCQKTGAHLRHFIVLLGDGGFGPKALYHPRGDGGLGPIASVTYVYVMPAGARVVLFWARGSQPCKAWGGYVALTERTLRRGSGGQAP